MIKKAPPKFKKGDVAIFYTNKNLQAYGDSRSDYFGKLLTIEEEFKGGKYAWLVKETIIYYFTEDEIELERVYNSPLFAALK